MPTSMTLNGSYRMPAEWAPHAATWLAWPHNRTDWPGKMAVIPWMYGEIIRALTASERVHLLVEEATSQRVRTILSVVGIDLAQVTWHAWPTNRGWTRDYGPMFALSSEKEPVVLDFRFTAWARYPGWQLDDAIAGRAAAVLQIPKVEPEHGGRRVVLEGGGIDVNGVGDVLTTEECWLDPRIQVRNPGWGREAYEAVFKHYLGAQNTLWLGRGVAGDDTHGHVDDCARFVAPDTIVIARAQPSDRENYAALEENRERLEGLRLANGRRPHVIELPMPAPLTFKGNRLPASYVNFYIANRLVFVPTFNDPQDRHALGILSEVFPDRTIVGIHAVDLVLGGGSLHCLTQQQPLV